MDSYFKYPRTMHMPWSPGTSSDDRLMVESDLVVFHGQQIVVTEKLDGENTTMYRDHIHARSLDGRPHPSQTWVRQLHGQISHEIPSRWRICGENMYAKHSIFYDRLPTFFFVFSIWNENNICLPWSETKEYAAMLGLQTVPELYTGVWDEGKVRACWTGKSCFGDEQEGYVVRLASGFVYPVVSENVREMPVFEKLAKYVRPKHVRTDDHWRTTWTPNKLALQI